MKMSKNIIANTLRNKRTATLAFILILTISSSAFIGITSAQADNEGNRMKYPVSAWRQEGPSPWYSSSTSPPMCRYNASGSAYNEYSTAPNTPHILWTYEETLGGVAGTGDELQWGIGPGERWPMSMKGLLAAAGRVFAISSEAGLPMIQCIDESTGELLWRSKLPSSIGGDISFQIVGGGVQGTSEQGLLFESRSYGYPTYQVSMKTGEVTANNSIPLGTHFKYGDYWYGSTGGINVRENFLYCYSTATRNFTCGPVVSGPIIVMADDVMVTFEPMQARLQGINRADGKILWSRAFSALCRGATGYGKFYQPGANGDFYAFDLHTGELVWKTQLDDATYFSECGLCIGDGIVCDANYNGKVYAFDAETGEVKWINYVGDCPYEPYKSWYGSWPFNQPPIGADGKIYAATGDHIIHEPSVPGERLFCWDAQTGDELWEYPLLLGGHGMQQIIADGLLFAEDGYTGNLIAFGKGPTAVEVSVAQPQIINGSYTWITGRVTDESPAQAGTGVVSDASMQEWMAYLHADMPEPASVTGVPVKLVAVGTDGTEIDLGTVTADGQGYFKAKWTPQNKEDTYTITATFEGSESYWDSSGQTELVVDPIVGVGNSVVGADYVTQASDSIGMSTIALSVATTVVCVTVTIASLRIRRNKEE